jgi:hypothetical protein
MYFFYLTLILGELLGTARGQGDSAPECWPCRVCRLDVAVFVGLRPIVDAAPSASSAANRPSLTRSEVGLVPRAGTRSRCPPTAPATIRVTPGTVALGRSSPRLGGPERVDQGFCAGGWCGY